MSDIIVSMSSKLLTREQFRSQTLARNNGVCVVVSCVEAAVDAHHILNRNLYTSPEEFGGYFLDNGAGLCSSHHLDAEFTVISVPKLYIYCEISAPVLPQGFDSTVEYDTWGNVVVNEYQRSPGPLFMDEGCQKALTKARVLWMFQ